MSLGTMIAELRGSVPGYSAMLARTHIRDAWRDVRNRKGWSFQLGNSGFSTPGLVNQGTATVVFGEITVTPDATAKAVWLSASQYGSLITQRQFRVGAGTIYNIVAIDNTTGVLTLDRPWIDPLTTYSGLGYSLYQCYYPVPVKEFEAWESVLDVINVIYLDTDSSKATRQFVDRNDPQRQIFSNPGALLPYQVDTRAGSSTLGWMLYELYPQPQSEFLYQTWYSWAGPDLVNDSDTLPYPITEHVIKTLARVRGYEWAEANKDPQNPRGSGADFRFLMGGAMKEAEQQLKEIRKLDKDRVDMFKATMSRVSGFGPIATFNPATGQVMSRNVG